MVVVERTVIYRRRTAARPAEKMQSGASGCTEFEFCVRSVHALEMASPADVFSSRLFRNRVKYGPLRVVVRTRLIFLPRAFKPLLYASSLFSLPTHSIFTSASQHFCTRSAPAMLFPLLSLMEPSTATSHNRCTTSYF